MKTTLDEIDHWLADSFGIIPGCCSSTDSLRYSVARRVAEVLWPKSELSEDLLEAAKEDSRRWHDSTLEMFPEPYERGFIAGANWQKKKMLKQER